MIDLLHWRRRFIYALRCRVAGSAEDRFERITQMPVFNAGLEDGFADTQPLGLADELFQINVHDDARSGGIIDRVCVNIVSIAVEHF
jgi:hypothetical protein